MRKLAKKLKLKNVGFLELLAAMYPILQGYSYGSIINLSIIVPLLLLLLALLKSPKVIVKPYKPLMVLCVFVMIHDIIWIFVIGDIQASYINTRILYLLVFLTIFIVTPRLNMDKFIGSVNWVSIICIIGLFYQGAIVLGGRGVTPLLLPFLPTPEAGAVTRVLMRPSSFFWEPNAYVTFMMIPLLLSLRNKTYFLSVIIIISLFLSTSTTGIVLSFIIVALHGASIKNSRSKLIVVVILIIMYIILTQSSFFEFGINKLNESDVTTDSRTANGPTFVFAMPWNHMILGAPYANTGDYYASGELGFLDIIVYGPTVYMASIWQMIALYGIVGTIFLLFLYVSLFKDCKTARPYTACLMIELFTASFFFGGSFCVQMMFILFLFYHFDQQRGLQDDTIQVRNVFERGLMSKSYNGL